MGKIKKVEIDSEVINLKKSLGEWKVIYPIKNEDGSINWKNLLIGGSWVRFFTLLGIIILILLAVGEYSNVVKIANECLNNSVQIIIP